MANNRELRFIHSPRTAGTSIRHALGLEGAADHSTLDYLRNKLGIEELEKLFTFTVIRNPYARLVSYCWLYRRSKEKFDHFVRAVAANGAAGIMCSQVSRISLDGIIRVNKILRFDTLADQWQSFARDFGLPPTLEHKNAIDHPPWHSFYTKELADIVYKPMKKTL